MEHILKKILIVGLNFYPEPTGTGKYTGELASFLSHHGYQVRVITAPPYYPKWAVWQGYHRWRYSREHWGQVTIFRCPLWVPKKPSGLSRLIHLATFTFSSMFAVFRQIKWKPDRILCIAPTLMSAPAALLLAKICGSQTFLHLQDFELDAAMNLGILPDKSWIYRFFSRIERSLLGRFDHLSTISLPMKEKLLNMGMMEEKCHLFPNWVDTDYIHPIDQPSLFRKEMGFSQDDVIVLYAGNLGYKQGLETVIQSAKYLQQDKNIYFVLCGDGAARIELEQLTSGLSNVRFLPVQPFNKLNELLALADIHVLPQKAGVADLVMPSKLSGMLASGKSVIAAADAGTEIGKVIDQTGVRVPPEDSKALAEAIHGLSENPEKRQRLGEKGRIYALKNWSAAFVLSQFLEVLDE